MRLQPLLLVLIAAPALGIDPGGTAPAEPEPSPAALLFGKRCGSCHTLGDGDRTGPDLLGVTKRREHSWLAAFIRAPGSFIDRGDPAATEMFLRFKSVKMPDQQLTDEELAELLAYIEECTAQGGCKLALGKVRPASEATPEDVLQGRLLFEGRRRLSGGGPPCMSCHDVRGVGIVGGGTLARDLTFAFARLGDAGLSAALADTPFPLMRSIYGARPLTPAEAFQIKAYLAEAAKDGTPPRRDANFGYLGVLGALFTLGFIGMVWSGRMTGVRRSIVGKGRP